MFTLIRLQKSGKSLPEFCMHFRSPSNFALEALRREEISPNAIAAIVKLLDTFPRNDEGELSEGEFIVAGSGYYLMYANVA